MVIICNSFPFNICRRRVFILGPSHHVRLSGCALSSCEKYQTPLYDLEIDSNGKVFYLHKCKFVML